MAELNLDRDYIEMLIVQIRGVKGKVPMTENAASGSNATDDDGPGLLAETPDDLTREEVQAEIVGLSPDEQAELVALAWLGRGEGSAEEWRALVSQARDRADTPTEDYLLDDPLVADFIAEGLALLDNDADDRPA